jgi:broad specificity phosphatase PhoE
LCRHGESLGNVDEKVYVHTADWRIPLSERGREQATAAGRHLASLLGDDRCYFYTSPYVRTKQTMQTMMEQLQSDALIGTREEPRIAEQQFGNFQNFDEIQRAKSERKKFGRFFYRFPNGEAGLDVYNRVSSFISTMFRDSASRHAQGQEMDDVNLVICTHGLTMRLLVMRWFQLSVEDFEAMRNPQNAALVCLERKTSECGTHSWFELTEEASEHLRISRSALDRILETERRQREALLR